MRDDDKPPLPDPEAPVREVISVGDLIERLQRAAQKKRHRMPHRILLMNAAFALQQLVQRLDKYENKETVN